MKLSPFDRRILIFLAVLGAAMGGLLWAGSRAGMPPPEINLPAEGDIGAFGPLVLEFHRPILAGEVAPYLRLEPAVAGRWSWDERQASFRPDRAFRAGETYTLHLDPGAKDAGGRVLKTGASWSFTVRSADLIFLGQVSRRPEVWLADGAGKLVRPLTETGGTVRDFAAYPGGERVVFSAENGQGGVDLWAVGRDGQDQHLLVDCGRDACLQPAVAPDETAITFSRRSAGAPQGEIWTLDLASGQSDALYPDLKVSGIDPDWSPQGRYLQFYDPENAQLRILDLNTGKVILIPTNQQTVGSWSPDGRKLLFARAETSEIGLPYVRIYEADLASGDIRLLEAADLGQVDSSLPVFSPDGGLLVMAMRGLASSANKQLWLAPLDGGPGRSITTDATASFAACAWDPGGELLALQRLQLASSGSLPQVLIWHRESGAFTVIAEDAAWPQWLP